MQVSLCLLFSELAMGLDGVEIVMDVEDHFGITIQNSEAECIRTVGDLVALIHGRVCAARSAHCLALPAFLELRGVVREITGRNMMRIRPHNTITEILSADQRRHLWRCLQQMLGSPPPGLRRPATLRRGLILSVLAALTFSLYIATQTDLLALPLALVATIVFAIAAHLLTRVFRSVPPDGWMTFADLTRKLLGKTAATRRVHLRTPDDILSELRPLLVDVLGVEASDVVPTARFIEDLGMS